MLRGPSSAVRRPPSAVRRPPSAVRRPSSAVRRPPSAFYPSAFYLHPATPREEVNLCKNLDELEKAKFLVDAEYMRISPELVSGNKDRKELEKSFDETFTKLKLAQSNLIKSIDHYKGVHFKQKMSFDKTDIIANTSTSTECNQDVELSDNEMNFLVSSVKDEFLDNL